MRNLSRSHHHRFVRASLSLCLKDEIALTLEAQLRLIWPLRLWTAFIEALMGRQFHVRWLAAFLTICFATFLAAAPSAQADGRRSIKDVERHHWQRPSRVTTAHGCYYHRGRRFCSRYCYWEYNGNRYCQPRAREAYPQGAYGIDEVYPRRARTGWRW